MPVSFELSRTGTARLGNENEMLQIHLFILCKHDRRVKLSLLLTGNNEPMWVVPSAKSKITSAVWGPLDEVIITGHENGELHQWDVSVLLSLRIYSFTTLVGCALFRSVVA